MRPEDGFAAAALAALLVLTGTKELPWWDITGGPPFSLMATTLQPVPRPAESPAGQPPKEDRPEPGRKGTRKNAGR